MGVEVTGVRGGNDLEESCGGREMESSSSSIAEVMMLNAALLCFNHSKELAYTGVGTNRRLLESVMYFALTEHGYRPEMEKAVWRGGEH